MNKEIESIVKKTAKIAGATCVAAGAVALVTSAAAVKAIVEGGRYLKDTVRKIIDEEPGKEGNVVDAEAEVVAEAEAESTVETEARSVEEAAEVVAEEADFAEKESEEA